MQDSTLLHLTVCVLGTTAILAVFLGFALPRYMLDEDMAKYSATSPESRGATQYLKKIDRYRIRSNIDHYPYMVSINRFIYQNVPGSLEFTCTGVIVSRDKVLTGMDCIAPMLDEASFLEYIVRSESSYFNRGGKIHNIERVHKTPESISFFPMFLLKIYPEVPRQMYMPTLALFSSDVPYLTTLGFGGYILPRHDVLLEAPFYENVFFKVNQFEGIKYAPVRYPKVIPSLLDYDKELVYEKAELCFKKCVDTSSRREQRFLTDGRPILFVKGVPPYNHYIFGMRMKGMKSWNSINDDQISSATYQNFLAFDIIFLEWLTQFDVPYSHTVREVLDGNMTEWNKWMYMEEAQQYIQRYHFVELSRNHIIPSGPGADDDD